MNHSDNGAALFGMGIVMALVALCFALAIYLFFCFCMKRICEKCGKNPGILIWIPIVNLIPLLEAAKLPVWMIILFFIPLANLVAAVILWIKLCEARHKSAALVIGIILLPFIFIPYLAFSE